MLPNSPARRRVLYIDNTAWHFVNHRKGLAQEALKAGYEVHLAIPQGDRIPAGLGEQVEVHRYPLSRRGTNPIEELGTLQGLTRLVRKVRPSLIHSLTLKPVLYGTLAARSVAGTRVVNGVTGLGYLFTAEAPRYRWIRSAFLRVLALASRSARVAYIFQHPDDAKPFLSAGIACQGSHEIIPGSGINMTDFEGIPENGGTPTVLMASRLLWDKGVEEFVEAARRLRARGVAAKFVLAGDSDPGNPECIPREVVEGWNREGAIEWIGWQDDIRSVLARTDVVCLPSRNREGVPRILLEAGAAGRAMVATDVPGCRDVVLGTQAGRLVPSRDPGRLAEALGQLLENRSECQALGRKAREAVRTLYSSERINAATLALYDRLLAH